MPSPFPGMNPYLENPSAWPSVHVYLITTVAQALVPQAPAGYFVAPESEMHIRELSAEERRLTAGRADVAVSTRDDRRRGGPIAAVMEAPVYGTFSDAVRFDLDRWVEIRDRQGRVVTVIEIISPSNKVGDRVAYENKRHRLIRDGVNLVEIDLVRAGGRLLMHRMPPSDYCVIVARAEERPAAGIWPIGLRDRLPTVPVPLRPPDADLRLDLQAVLDQVYDAGGFAGLVDLLELVPPLEGDDLAWAESIRAT